MARWITYKGRHLLVDDDGNIVQKKKYIGEQYTPENVNDYFQQIETYEQFEEFENDFYDKLKMVPYIVPVKHPIGQWVAFTKKGEDNEHIKFSVLSEDYSWARKTQSTIKNFVKNYKVHLE